MNTRKRLYRAKRLISASKRLAFLFGGLFIFSFALAGCAPNQQTALNPHGPDSARTALISWWMFGVAAVVLAFVTVLLLIALLRRRPGQAPSVVTPPSDRKVLWLALIGGAIAPIVILLIFMGWGITIEQANAAPQAKPENVVEIIGHQWWWEVRYPLQGVVTANEIHIPANTPFTVKLTTADVIHSFWVPELHGKMDLIPGQTNTIVIQANQPGIYQGQCAEYCGAQHAHMRILVIADTQHDFQSWLSQESKPAPDPPPGSLEKAGQQTVLGSSCVYCHTIKGTNASGKIGPDLTHLASRMTIAAGTLPNTPGNLAGWIINSQTIKPGNRMPPMDLNSDQVQAILAYLEMLK